VLEQAPRASVLHPAAGSDAELSVLDAAKPELEQAPPRVGAGQGGQALTYAGFVSVHLTPLVDGDDAGPRRSV